MSAAVAAAVEMQKILFYECPRIVCYNNYYLCPYRTDVFEGFVTSDLLVPWNPFTYLSVHRKQSEGGPYGGTFRIADEIGNSFSHLSMGYVLANADQVNNHMSLLLIGPEKKTNTISCSKNANCTDQC